MRPIFCAAIITLVTGLSFARDPTRGETWRSTILEQALIRAPRILRGIKCVCVCARCKRGKWSVERGARDHEKMIAPFHAAQTRPVVSHRWKWNDTLCPPYSPFTEKNEFARVDFCFLRPRDWILFFLREFALDRSSLIRPILENNLNPRD